MSPDLSRFAAYHGKGWQPRPSTLEREMATRASPWSEMRVDSEFRDLRAVLLHRPGPELARIRDPNRIQHLERIDPKGLTRELSKLALIYRGLGIEVHYLDRTAFPGAAVSCNLMYGRDLFFNTRAGAVIARMGSRIRAGEEKYASHALAGLSIPIARTIGGSGLFEGADALWLNPKTVLCGIGARTNAEGARQLGEVLALQDVRVLPVALPPGIQHLLGLLQIVSTDLALIRVEKAPDSLRTRLRRAGLRLIEIPEIDEVRLKQGMNVVTVRSRTVIMPAGCPHLRRLYAESGLRVVAEVETRELIKGAGGIACATGILAREISP